MSIREKFNPEYLLESGNFHDLWFAVEVLHPEGIGAICALGAPVTSETLEYAIDCGVDEIVVVYTPF